MSSRTRIPAALLALSLPLALTACGSDPDTEGGHGSHSSSTPSSTVSVAPDEDHNSADITFATSMIPHHAQALSMTDLADGRTVSPEFQELVDQVKAAQGPEVDTMTGWLLEWYQPVPETSRDHANAHGGDSADGHDMAGMMTDAQMEELADASDAEFEQLWLEMMIEHHRGAVTMAEVEVEDGRHPAAQEMAQVIIDSQEAEIETMQSMLDAG